MYDILLPPDIKRLITFWFQQQKEQYNCNVLIANFKQTVQIVSWR